MLALSFRGGRRPAAGQERALPPAPEASGQATTLLEGFDFTESVRGKPLMRIQADRTIGYGPAAGLAPNLYAGEKVALTVYPDDGPPVTVHSERAHYDERTRESRLSGNVRWTDKDGGLAETEEIVFRPKTRVLEAPKQVRFTQGSTGLTAPSARYDIAERVLYFAGPVEASGTGETGGLSTMTARKGLYRRDSGAIELEFVTGQSAFGRSRRGRCDGAADGRGGRSSLLGAPTGNVRGILAAGGRPPGPAVASSSPPRERQYSGDVGTVAFDGDGRTKSVALEGAPALLSEADRRLTARRIDIGFADGRAVTAAAAGEVRLDSANGQARAARGTLGFAADGTAENAVLDGGVNIEADGRTGDAEKVVELTAKRLWQLTGTRKARGACHERRLETVGRHDRDRPRGRDRPRAGARPRGLPAGRAEEGALDGLRRRPEEADLREGGPDRPRGR